MAVVWYRLVKPCVVAALVGLIAAYFVPPLPAAIVAVAVLWVLLVVYG